MSNGVNNIAVNSYMDGLEKDVSKFKYKPSNYYDAYNIRVITNSGLSTGSIENVKGTRLDFKIPDLPQQVYTEPNGVTVTIPALTNLKIIGGTSNFNRVIIFTTALGEGINEYYGQIWMFEYDEDTDTIKGINTATNELVYNWTTMGTGVTSGDITESGYVHLMYSRLLNFRDTNRIQAFCRNESDKFFRLYWVDGGLNQLRSLNLAPNPWGTTDTALNKIQGTPLDSIDFITTAKLRKPQITNIINGNLPNGRVCYFYRLLTKDGALTTFSPTSDFVDLNAGNIYGPIDSYPETYDDYRTTGEQNEDRKTRLDLNSEKAVEVTFNNLDQNYDYIQCGYILYQEQANAELYLFPEKPFYKNLTGVASYSFIHDGLEERVFPITLEEFTQISGVFENPKCITTLHNWLTPANTKSSQFSLKDIDDTFDARTYSFNSSGTAYIADKNGVLETAFTNITLPNPDKYLDSINPDYDIYKYQGNGTTLGGEGVFIKYSFVNTSMYSDLTFGTSSWVDGKDRKIGAPFITPAQDQESYADLRSPYKSSVLTSHARGEKYRYGLVGVDKQGRESFVEWIADIKMPGFDEYPLTSIDNSAHVLTHSLGIKFEITLTETLYEYLREIRIVRVKRTEDDMTRLGTGITGSFCQYRPHRLKWKDIADAIAGFLVQLVDGVVSPILDVLTLGLAKLLTTFTGFKSTVKGVLKKLIVKILTAPSKLCILNTASMDDERLKQLIKSSLTSFSWFLPIIGPAIVSTFGESFIEHVFDKIKDSFKKQVANISENVYSLNNWNMHKDLLDGYTGVESTRGYSSIGGKNYGYVISPIHQFDKYQFRYGDKLKIVGVPEESDTGASYKISQIYHRNTETEMLNRTHSTAAIRKWYKSSWKNGTGQDTLNRIGWTTTIDLEKTLDVGEIIVPPENSGLPQGAICNAFIGCKERYNDDNQYFINKYYSRIPKVMGIGDKKQLIKVNTVFPMGGTKGFVVLDQQGVEVKGSGCGEVTQNYNGIELSSFTNGGAPFSTAALETTGTFPDIKLSEPRVIDGPGDYIVSYEREVSNQYGGDGYVNRSFNDYIEVETINIAEFDSNNYKITTNIYKGDTFVGLYAANNYNYYFDKFPGYEKAIKTKKALGEIFPVEAPFNFNLREGKHFLISQNTYDLDQTESQIVRKIRRARRKSKRLGLDLNTVTGLIVPNRFLYDEFIYDDVYHQLKDFKKFQQKPVIDIFTEYTHNRVWRSEVKQDGELIDSWRLYKPLNYIEVDGNYGPINNVTNFRSKLVFFQNNAFGIIMTNEDATVTDDNGKVLQLATTIPFSSYDYISTELGCSHRFAVVTTNSALYFTDVLRKKIYKFGEGLEPLSDLKGISGYLRENVVGNIVNTDSTVSAAQNAGIHGEYYPEHNIVLFTFQNYSAGIIGRNTRFTIGYNIILNKFESFYSFTPGLYIRTPNRVITSNNNDEGHQLFKGNYGEFFNTYYDSYITLLTNGGEQVYNTKVYNNISLYTEVYDTNGNNLPLETINSVRYTNDYQDSGVIALTPSTGASNPDFNLIIRKERKWYLTIERATAASANTTLESRMRDFYQLTKLSFTNNANKRFILHDTLTHYSVSQV